MGWCDPLALSVICIDKDLLLCPRDAGPPFTPGAFLFSPLPSTAAIHNQVSNIAISNLPERDRRCRLRPKDQTKRDEENAADRTHQSVQFDS
jgi:hypothetical protein